IMFMMSFFVLPNMMKMLEGTTQQLPLITRVVMRFSALIKNWGWLALILLTGAGFLLAQYYRTANGRKIIDRLILKIPLVGKFLKTVYLSQFASNLSVLISGALPIARAMEITAEIISNTAFKDIILQGREGVRRGVPISSILEKHQDIFPPIFCQMTLVGEKTGTLDKTLMNIVGFYEKEVDRDLNTLLSVLEPLMIIILGLMVGGLLAAVLLPLYKAMSI
ncbi:MAG: type II secretion system F family protein, partial [Patescibacteria group bacterium]